MSVSRFPFPAVLLVAAGCLLTACQTESSTSAEQAITPSASTAPKAPAACVDAGSVTAPPPGPPSALSVSVSRVLGYGGEDYVLPPAIRTHFPQFAGGQWPADDALVERALREGAFVYGRPFVTVVLENTAGSDLTITDLRATHLQTVCLPKGLLLRMGQQGGDDKQLSFDLDAARPVALKPVPEGQVPYEPFFTQDAVTIPAGEQTDLMMTFSNSRNARVFDLTATYVQGGKSYTQVIQPAGGLFRAMPQICPATEDVAKLTEPDLAALAAHRFDEVLDVDTTSKDAYAQFFLRERDPQEFSADCTTR
jgi:hypothetical protein